MPPHLQLSTRQNIECLKCFGSRFPPTYFTFQQNLGWTVPLRWEPNSTGPVEYQNSTFWCLVQNVACSQTCFFAPNSSKICLHPSLPQTVVTTLQQQVSLLCFRRHFALNSWDFRTRSSVLNTPKGFWCFHVRSDMSELWQTDRLPRLIITLINTTTVPLDVYMCINI